jgi:tRNA dimethylallyltransferase
LGGEIIGADAFQVYRGIPVLTSQPGEAERGGVPHHLVGFLDPAERFDAGRFVREARRLVVEIQARGKVPLVVGGTGLYLKALVEGLDEMPEPDEALRAEISAMPLPQAVVELQRLDPAGAEAVDLKNPARVRRALELVRQAGRPLAEVRCGRPGGGMECAGVCLVREREELRERIAANVEAMLTGGAVDEVRQISEQPCGGAARAIGFREIGEFLAGRLTIDECRESITTATRRYAKRQLTWCRTQLNFQSIVLNGPNTPGSALDAALRLAGRACT